tara:strand:+ start:10209 stop:10472 length:264 start_codon:yes stop_codon:yes gene_type:complete
MKITTNNTTYNIESTTYDWVLTTPSPCIDKETGEVKTKYVPTYHKTAGQCLAAIAEKELGKARDVEELLAMVVSLRRDLMANTVPSQ